MHYVEKIGEEEIFLKAGTLVLKMLQRGGINLKDIKEEEISRVYLKPDYTDTLLLSPRLQVIYDEQIAKARKQAELNAQAQIKLRKDL